MSRQKEMFASAYQPWTKDDEEFLKKYWRNQINEIEMS